MNPTAAPRNDSFDVLTIYNPSSTPFEVRYNDEPHAIIQPYKAIQLVKIIAGDSEHGAIKHLIDRMCRLNGKPKNEPKVRDAWFEKVVISKKKNQMPVVPTIVDQARAMNQELAQAPIDVPLPAYPPVRQAAAASIKGVPGVNIQPVGEWKFDPITGAPITKSTQPIITPESVDTSHIEIQTAEASMPVAAANGQAVPQVLPQHPEADANTLLAGIRKTDTGEGEGKVIGEIKADEPPAAPEVPKRTENPSKEDLINYARDVMMMNIDDAATREGLEAQSVDELKNTLKYDIYA